MPRPSLRFVLPICFLAATACATGRRADVGPSPAPATADHDAATALAGARVYDARRDATVALATMFDSLARADVVFVGERHDDAATHRLELAVLEALAARGRPVVLALEMFERDVQPLLDAYLAGRASEAEFLAGARPWPNYATDYRPLVEFARAQGWPVLASNVPRPIAALVARGGLAALDTLPPARRAHAAAELRCPDDPYRAKFVATMRGMPGHADAAAPAGPPDSAHAAADAAVLQRFYEAQCVKDETMAESVARALRAGATVVHVNGAFHSDERLGTAARLLRRRPAARTIVVATVPGGAAAADAGASGNLGDYVVLLP
ncbi:MAG TPA: ChaN family lipoprotein [Gemmatimonadaceae bacterium]|nr:ChaN family lipoprotein [Gemmatimonadaceae bacterium]